MRISGKLNVLALIIIVMMLSSVVTAEVVPATRRLIPKPIEVENYDMVFDLTKANWLTGSQTDKLGLLEYLEELGLKLQSDRLATNAYFGTVEDLKEVPELKEELAKVPENPEGYFLEVTENRLTIIGRTEVGAFYGIQTLRQLTDQNQDTVTVVGTKITDYPVIRYRAFTDDVSRGPIPTLEYMKLIVKTMSSFKLNMYSPYMELHVLEGIRGKEETISTKDYKELVQYAKKYHVEVVPSLQTFGHSTVFLSLKDYRHLGNLPANSSQLDPTNPAVYKFLEEQIAKWAALTDSQFINISGDETWEIGQGNSGIQTQKIGAPQVYLDHIVKVMEIVKKNGKTPLFWGDMVLEHPELIAQLPSEAIILNWHYGDASSMPKRLETFQSRGKTQWAAPGIDNWLRIFPFYQSSNTNVAEFARIGAKHGIEGLFTTSWDDDGENLFGNNWYGLIFASEAAWRGGNTNTVGFNQRFDQAVFGEKLGIVEAMMKLSTCNYYTYKNYFKNSNALFLQNPFQNLEIYEMVGNANTLLLMEKQVLNVVDNVTVKRNSHMLRTLGYSARKNGTFGRKILLTKEVIDTVAELEGSDQTEELLELAQKLYAFEREVSDIFKEFEELYLEENKPSFINVLKDRYFNLRASIFSVANELEGASYGETVPSPIGLGLPISPRKK